jgi:hypothetical protein
MSTKLITVQAAHDIITSNNFDIISEYAKSITRWSYHDARTVNAYISCVNNKHYSRAHVISAFPPPLKRDRYTKVYTTVKHSKRFAGGDGEVNTVRYVPEKGWDCLTRRAKG